MATARQTAYQSVSVTRSKKVTFNPSSSSPVSSSPTVASARDVIMSDAMRMSHQPARADEVKQTEPSINKAK